MDSMWDYQVMTYRVGWSGFRFEKIEEDLKELGRQGWELTSTLAPSFGSGQAIDVAVIVKRPLGH